MMPENSRYLNNSNIAHVYGMYESGFDVFDVARFIRSKMPS